MNPNWLEPRPEPIPGEVLKAIALELSLISESAYDENDLAVQLSKFRKFSNELASEWNPADSELLDTLYAKALLAEPCRQHALRAALALETGILSCAVEELLKLAETRRCVPIEAMQWRGETGNAIRDAIAEGDRRRALAIYEAP